MQSTLRSEHAANKIQQAWSAFATKKAGAEFITMFSDNTPPLTFLQNNTFEFLTTAVRQENTKRKTAAVIKRVCNLATPLPANGVGATMRVNVKVVLTAYMMLAHTDHVIDRQSSILVDILLNAARAFVTCLESTASAMASGTRFADIPDALSLPAKLMDYNTRFTAWKAIDTMMLQYRVENAIGLLTAARNGAAPGSEGHTTLTEQVATMRARLVTMYGLAALQAFDARGGVPAVPAQH